MEMDLADRLWVLGDPQRLNLVRTLLKIDLCVGALARRLGLSEPALSQHLKLLREAGMVQGEKRGYWTHYRIDREALRGVARELADLAELPQPFEAACGKPAITESKASKGRQAKSVCRVCCRQAKRSEAKRRVRTK